MTNFVCWIPGKATPQGSKTGFVINGKAILVDASTGNKAWREIVKSTIKSHKDYIRMPGPVNVALTFYMQKAKSNKTTHMAQKPDVDKLARSVLDGISDSELIEDDQRVIYLTARKQWADENTNPGVLITVWQEKTNA